MKKTIFLAIFLFLTIGLSAQQTIKSENVDSFTSVSLSGNVYVDLIPSVTNAIDIVLTDSQIEKFKWGVKDGALSVNLRPSNKGMGRADIKIYYSDPIEHITMSGAELFCSEPIESTTLKLDVTSGSRMLVAVDVLDLELIVTGNSIAQVSGQSKYLYLRANENSKVDTREMASVSAEVEAGTRAEVYIAVEERFIANAKTSSTIFYKGSPEILKDKSSRVSLGSTILNIGQ